MSLLRRRLFKVIPIPLFSDHEDYSNDSEVEIIDADFGEKRAGSYLQMLKSTGCTLSLLWTHSLRNIRLFFNPNGSLYSDWEAMSLFECWCVQFHKTYPSVEERLYRATVFKESLEWVYRQNQKEKGVSYRPQQWADLTEDELIRMSNVGDDSD